MKLKNLIDFKLFDKFNNTSNTVIISLDSALDNHRYYLANIHKIKQINADHLEHIFFFMSNMCIHFQKFINKIIYQINLNKLNIKISISKYKYTTNLESELFCKFISYNDYFKYLYFGYYFENKHNMLKFIEFKYLSTYLTYITVNFNDYIYALYNPDKRVLKYLFSNTNTFQHYHYILANLNVNIETSIIFKFVYKFIKYFKILNKILHHFFSIFEFNYIVNLLGSVNCKNKYKEYIYNNILINKKIYNNYINLKIEDWERRYIFINNYYVDKYAAFLVMGKYYDLDLRYNWIKAVLIYNI